LNWYKPLFYRRTDHAHTKFAHSGQPSFDVVQEKLGQLLELIGTWSGKGFNLVALPDKHDNNPFQLMVNSTHETLTFASTGVIPNRGGQQDDIRFFGLQYFQEVHNAETDDLLHLEPGFWLNLPATTAPSAESSIVRLSTIPHGDALLAQGTASMITGCPEIPAVDSTPIEIDGSKVPDTSPYLDPYKSTPLPAGIPEGSIKDPNTVLRNAIAG
jgi:hypothetical protein